MECLIFYYNSAIANYGSHVDLILKSTVVTKELILFLRKKQNVVKELQ
jgi:hypothetical protein